MKKLISVFSFVLMSVRVPVERQNGHGVWTSLQSEVGKGERKRKGGGRREERIGRTEE